MTSFIEKQFPVSKLSKESYKERKANNGQTLTGLGKWWGRKPLVLERGAILGCLMPISDDPRKDMEIFLKIMSMDDDGLWQRNKQWQNKSDAYWLEREYGLHNDFNNLGYDEKLKTCVRPEQFTRSKDDPAWSEINQHLGTNADNLQDLMRQLSEKRFGSNATIGDCFCGGGSIPFEAARMGLDVYASDLNPIAGLLTWAAIHICGASEYEIAEIKAFQQEVYDAVDKEITALGIEHSEEGHRAVSYLYCVEVICPECGVLVPMAPSWVIGKGTKTVAKLVKNGNSYNIEVKMNVTSDEMKFAEIGTATSKGLLCPNCDTSTSISSLRRDRRGDNGEVIYGLRKWEKSEFEPKFEDVFQERLYCIKYEKPSEGKNRPVRYYRAPNEHDFANEKKVRTIVEKNIVQWQEQGLVPSMEIESGYNTDQIIRERGWTHWNHLFNARQLHLCALHILKSKDYADSLSKQITEILTINRIANWNSKLSQWSAYHTQECGLQTFYNQALNTFFNYATRALTGLHATCIFEINAYNTSKKSDIRLGDARNKATYSHIWITDHHIQML